MKRTASPPPPVPDEGLSVKQTTTHTNHTPQSEASTSTQPSKEKVTNSPSQDQTEAPLPTISPAAASLTRKITTLESQIQALESELASTYAELTPHLSASSGILSSPGHVATATPVAEAAEGVVKRHIKQLHEYNEIKDVGLGLMSLIADARGVRLGEVMEEFGVGGED